MYPQSGSVPAELAAKGGRASSAGARPASAIVRELAGADGAWPPVGLGRAHTRAARAVVREFRAGPGRAGGSFPARDGRGNRAPAACPPP